MLRSEHSRSWSRLSSLILMLTREEADLLHSREQRAFGETSKGKANHNHCRVLAYAHVHPGGIASQAQSLASDNKQKGSA